jgi:death-on-curing protein
MTDFLAIDEVVMMHEILIRRYGGLTGLRDRSQLEAAIFRPQSGYYADTILQAAALFESLIMNHPFVDGNKRLAFAATDVFLRMNGFKINIDAKDAYRAIIKMLENPSLGISDIDQWLRGIVTP